MERVLAATKDKAMNTRLGKWLAQWMDERSLSNREFAKLAGLNYETVRHILEATETTGHQPSLDTVFKIARATHITEIELWDMIAPPDLRRRTEEAQIERIAARIAALSPEHRRLIELFLRGARFEDREKGQ